MGKTTLQRVVRQPLTDLDEINKRLDIVQVLKNNTFIRSSLLESPIVSAPDVDFLITNLLKVVHGDSTKKIKGSQLLILVKLHSFYSAVFAAHSIVTSHKPKEEEREEKQDSGSQSQTEATNVMVSEEEGEILYDAFGKDLENILPHMSVFCQLVEHVIDFDSLPREIRINPKHSEELGEIRDEMEGVREKMERHCDRGNQKWGCVGDVKLEEDKAHGFILRSSKANDERTLRDELGSDVTILSILKNGVHFTTTTLESLSEVFLERRKV